ncbi:hypothetical protein G6F66_015576 [Rhizopus arrhizus]|nr:hypothetical protein G6F66_015576 [Rhizopus arrhizus]
MTLKFSSEPTPRPPETTRLALCRSGRSLAPAARPTKRVWVGSGASTLAASTAALPPWAASGQDAARTVATTTWSAGASTVMIALPA